MVGALIAGIGSSHGADRLGWLVVDALRETHPAPHVRLVDCASPVELVPLLRDHPRTLVVDAMLGSGPAGTIHLLRQADLPGMAQHLSSHGVGLADAIRLACALGMPSERLSVLALDVMRPDAGIEQAWIAQMVHGAQSWLAEA